MAIDTSAYVTAAEAARKLGLSVAQVRRRLREGKLRGARLGNQWLVEEEQLRRRPRPSEPLISAESRARIEEIKKQIAERNPGYVFDSIEMLKRHRGEA